MRNWTKIIALIATIVVFAVGLTACGVYGDNDRASDVGHTNIDVDDVNSMNGETEISDYESNDDLFGRWRYERILPCGEAIAIELILHDAEWDYEMSLTVFGLDEGGLWVRHVQHSFEWKIQDNRFFMFIPQFHDVGYEESFFRIFGDNLIIYDGGMFSYVDGLVSSGTEAFHDADWSGETLIFVKVP